MTLLDLIAAIGERELARRLGIKVKTLKDWIRKGTPRTRVDDLNKLIARRQRSLKSAATRRADKEFAKALPAPPEVGAKPLDEELPVTALEAVTPKRRPPKFEASAEVTTLVSDYNIGEEHWFTVNKSALDVDLDELIDAAVRVFQDSNRDFASVRFLLFRYIAKGSLRASLDKWGTWQDWWINTEVATAAYKFVAEATPRDIGRRMLEYWNIVIDAAKSRVIWLSGFGVTTFDRKPPR